MSKETYISLTHTVGTFVILIRELLQHNILKSILLGKFQTDQLESRFCHNRQLSGRKYLVKVLDVMAKRLLKLYSASNGIINMLYISLIGRQLEMAVRMPTPINQLFNNESIAVQIIFLDV